MWHQKEQEQLKLLLSKHNTLLNTGLANDQPVTCSSWTLPIVTSMKVFILILLPTPVTDNEVLDVLGISNDVEYLFSRLGWHGFTFTRRATYPRIVLEFLSTLQVEGILSGPRVATGHIICRLMTTEVHMAPADFNEIFGLPIGGEWQEPPTLNTTNFALSEDAENDDRLTPPPPVPSHAVGSSHGPRPDASTTDTVQRILDQQQQLLDRQIEFCDRQTLQRVLDQQQRLLDGQIELCDRQIQL
ncbi:hypothetical protein Salat_1649500 [Sesamum alatum]|uniref:Arabidopsis retrotransposon Orf1 C-terminal domain-containing protein n=1 Tax=Sesamum alatum TaxID=300844 RepID=A0AAE1Y6N4_9LAMI|nr:hypothetical protein Salat_1649500 [Sesamum alatum]